MLFTELLKGLLLRRKIDIIGTPEVEAVFGGAKFGMFKTEAIALQTWEPVALHTDVLDFANHGALEQ